jgi:DNA-binding response OmpR family regulator
VAYRALVIEDDVPLAEVLRMKLEREGHQVSVAPSQRDAYHLLGDESFDFALLDLRLPTHMGDMDPNSEVGFAILKYIRERFAADKLPVIVMTAYEGTSQTAVRALRNGANDYIAKPFEDSAVSLDEKLREIILCIKQASGSSAATKSTGEGKAHRIVFRPDCVELDGIVVPGRSADLIRVLGTSTLMLSVKGTSDQDPRMPGKEIAKVMNVQEATVRQYVTRFREWIATERLTRNLAAVRADAIVRNTRDWKGYELNREVCELSIE